MWTSKAYEAWPASSVWVSSRGGSAVTIEITPQVVGVFVTAIDGYIEKDKAS